MPYIAGSICLDAFAGAGSLGIEALSRNASYCAFCEHDKAVASQIVKNLELLKTPKKITTL